VEWLNHVDATYRGDLRELNELNFARFEAKLDKQLAELRVEFRTEVGALRTELHTGLARLEGGLLARIGLAEGRLARRTASLWIATLVALTALIKL
jgi:hypothetical protein